MTGKTTYSAAAVQRAAKSLLQPLEDLGTMASATDDERRDEWLGDAIEALQAVARIYGRDWCGPE